MSAKQIDSCPTDEALAAFVDGRLSQSERSSLTEHFAQCDGCREVLAETVRFQMADEPTVAPLETLSPRSLPATRRWVASGLAAAAAVLVAIILSPLLPAGAPSSAGLLAELGDGSELRARLGESWETPLWPARRGGAVLEAEPTTAFRLGVRVVDLRAAVQAEDRARATEIARSLRQALASIELAEPLVTSYDQVVHRLEGGASWHEIRELTEVSERLVDDSLDPEHTLRLGSFSMGRFAAAGRLAARTGSADLLGSRRLRRYLSDLRASGPPAALDPTLVTLSQSLEAGGSRLPFPALESSFSEWIRLAGEGALEHRPP